MIKKVILKRLLRKSRSINSKVELLTLNYLNNEIINELINNETEYNNFDIRLFKFLDDVNNVYKEELTK